MPEIGVVHLLQTEGTEILDEPRVSAAAASADDKVQVTFDQAVRASNPGNSDDALNPANYVFTSGPGVTRTAVSVAWIQGMPTTIVEITLDGEMTDGVVYNVEVINVRSIFDKLIDELFDNKDFTGQGTDPFIDTVAVPSETAVDITFSEEMLNNAALTTPSNYIFVGSPLLTPTSVIRLSGTVVRVVVNEMRDGAAYTVQAQNIFDIALNPITPATKPFTGVGVGPYIAFVLPLTSDEVRVTFSETVFSGDAGNPSNYQIYKKGFPAIQLPIVSATQHTPQTYDLLLSTNQNSGVDYTLQTDNIRDIAGNVQDPNPDTEDFVGIGHSPPNILISPEDGSADVPIRRYVSITFVDPAAEFTGIKLSSVWVKIEYTDENGVAHSDYAVQGGVLQAAYEGHTRGAADAAEGITFYFRPSSKTWASRQRYNISAYAEDNEASISLVVSIFDTAVPECFEDIADATFTTLEQRLLTTTGLYNVDRLREELLRVSTLSPVRRTQARTLVWLASLTDLQGVLAGLVDFETLVGATVQLCDRSLTQEVFSKMTRLVPVAIRAIDEIPTLVPEARNMLRDRVENNSPVYAVNAMAIIVLSAIVFGEF